MALFACSFAKLDFFMGNFCIMTADKMKDAVIAKLSSQCEELYVEVLKLFQKELLRPLWDKEWIPTVSIFTGIIVSCTECWCFYFSLCEM
jgi:hypothetical protein